MEEKVFKIAVVPSLRKLAEFINTNKIKREDIVTVIRIDTSAEYQLLYYQKYEGE